MIMVIVDGITKLSMQPQAVKSYCTEINELLRDYKEGYELSSEGEILALADEGLTTLLEANLPAYDPDNVEIASKQRRFEVSTTSAFY